MADTSILSKRPPENSVRSRMLRCGVENFAVSEEPTWTATLTIPGLGIESTDRDGNPKMQSLMMVSGLSRWYSLNVPYDEYGSTFMDWSTVTDGVYAFLAATEISVTREMYDQTVDKKIFDAKVMLGHVSNTSLSSLNWMYVPGITKPVLEQINCVVTVSKATRKAIALPDWFKEKYKGKGAMDKPLRVIPHQRPTSTFVFQRTVAWSDTDNYKHTNFSSYIRFAVDGMHASLADNDKRIDDDDRSSSMQEVCGNGALKGLTKGIVQNGLKNVKILYLHECLEGQELDVHIWQETGIPHTVKCAIENRQTDICHLTLEYFDDS